MGAINHQSFESGGLVVLFERYKDTHDILSAMDIDEVPKGDCVRLIGCNDEGTEGSTILYYAVPKEPKVN